jgi:hypothetical protein
MCGPVACSVPTARLTLPQKMWRKCARWLAATEPVTIPHAAPLIRPSHAESHDMDHDAQHANATKNRS